MLTWSDLSALTKTANALYREEWALLNWLSDNIGVAPDEEVHSIVDMLIRNGVKIDDLDNGGHK